MYSSPNYLLILKRYCGQAILIFLLCSIIYLITQNSNSNSNKSNNNSNVANINSHDSNNINSHDSNNYNNSITITKNLNLVKIIILKNSYWRQKPEYMFSNLSL